MERCKCLFMGISSVSSFYPVAPKTVKLQKNGVRNGVCLLAVCQEFNKNNFAVFKKAVEFQIKKCYIIEKEQPPTSVVSLLN